jgi:hypothetical protein
LKATQLDSSPLWPWAHTQNEFDVLLRALQDLVDTEVVSLDHECPSIIRALKMFSRIHQGRHVPICHPKFSLTIKKLQSIAKDSTLGKHLSTFSQDVVDSGWLCFPGITSVEEDVSQCNLDVNGLLGTGTVPPESILA